MRSLDHRSPGAPPSLAWAAGGASPPTPSGLARTADRPDCAAALRQAWALDPEQPAALRLTADPRCEEGRHPEAARAGFLDLGTPESYEEAEDFIEAQAYGMPGL